jgi:hypothetical protein
MASSGAWLQAFALEGCLELPNQSQLGEQLEQSSRSPEGKVQDGDLGICISE